jgi:flagellar biosynthesis anti-sigma factor FlgM
MKTDGGMPPEGRDLHFRAEKIAGFKNAIGRLPEIRTGKIEAIKKALTAGTYEIDSEKIAVRLIYEVN